MPYSNSMKLDAQSNTYKCDTVLWPTVHFGGQGLGWTIERKFTGYLLKKVYGFENNKFVLPAGDTSAPADNKEIPIRAVDAYYLDGFHNNGNVPAFNPVAIDTLPDKFDVQRIEIQLEPDEENPRQLNDWFKSEPLHFIFNNEKNETVAVSARDLGIGASETTDETTLRTTYTFEIGGAIQRYLREPEHKDWTFARQFTLNIKERVEPDETLPGRIAVIGQTDGYRPIINTVRTEYEHWYWVIPTVEQEGHYEIENKQVGEDTATLTPVPPNPQLQTHGVLRPETGEAILSPANGSIDVPIHERVSALRYVLGNGNNFRMRSGCLRIGPLFDETKDFDFLTDEVYISKELLEHASLERIVLVNEYDSETVIDGQSLVPSAPGTGISLKTAQFMGSDHVKEVRVYVKDFDGSVDFDANAYVELRGAAKRIGAYEAQGVWSSDYRANDIPDVSTSGVAKLMVQEAQPVLGTHGIYRDAAGQETIGGLNTYQEVPLDQDAAGLRYVLGNTSISVLSQGALKIGPLFLKYGDSYTRYGFKTNKIRISVELLECGTIENIVLSDKSGKEIMLDLPAEIGKDGLTIEESAWKAKDPTFGEVNQITVNFSYFGSKIGLDRGAAIDLLGTDTRPGQYAAPAVWGTNYLAGILQNITVSNNAYLRTQEAVPQLEGHGVWRTEPEQVGAVEQYQKVPLNEDAAALRYVIGNTSVSHMAPGRLTISDLLSKSGNRWNGFQANEICFSSALLEHATIDRIELTDEQGRQVVLSGDKLPTGKMLCIPESLWKTEDAKFGSLMQIDVCFDRFDGGVDLAQNAYVEVRGTATYRYNYSVPARWQTDYNMNGEISMQYRDGSAKVQTVPAAPSVSAIAQSQAESGKNVPLLYKDQGCYQFAIENKSATSVGRSEILLTLESVAEQGGKTDARYLRGFDTEKIWIGNSYPLAGEIETIELYDWDQNPDKDTAKVTLTLEEAEQYKDAEGNIVLPREAFKDIQYLNMYASRCGIFMEMPWTHRSRVVRIMHCICSCAARAHGWIR